VCNARRPVNPKDRAYNFRMQQLENKFVVGNVRQPVNNSDKTYIIWNVTTREISLVWAMLGNL
jgi:hypothetical protein